MTTLTTKSGTIIIVIAAIIAALIIAIFAYFVFGPEAPPISQIPSKPKEIVPPPATGNIDDAVNALIKEISDEESVLKTEEGDAGLITTDSQEIGDFGQSIKENEL